MSIEINNFKVVEVEKKVIELKKKYVDFSQEMTPSNFANWCLDLGMREIENRYEYSMPTLVKETYESFKRENFDSIIEQLKEYGNLDNLNDNGIVDEYSDGATPIYHGELLGYAQHNQELTEFEDFELIGEHSGSFSEKIGIAIYETVNNVLQEFCNNDFEYEVELLERLEELENEVIEDEKDKFDDINCLNKIDNMYDELLVDEKEGVWYNIDIETLNEYVLSQKERVKKEWSLSFAKSANSVFEGVLV